MIITKSATLKLTLIFVDNQSLLFGDERGANLEFKPLHVGMKVKDIAVTKDYVIIVNGMLQITDHFRQRGSSLLRSV